MNLKITSKKQDFKNPDSLFLIPDSFRSRHYSLFMLHNSSRRGQSLLEVLIAVTLAAIFLGGAVALIVAFTGSNKRNREIQTAIDLGNGLIENTRILANQNWQNIYGLNKDTSSGLVANWKFDVDASDSTGNANGTLSGGASIASGKIGNALFLNGTTAYVDLPGNPVALKFQGSQSSMSIAGWAKLSTLPFGSGGWAIISNDGNPGNRSWNLDACRDCQTWRFIVSGDGTDANTVSRWSASPLTTNWTHIVGTYNASAQTMNMYINGVLDNGTLKNNIPISQSNSPYGPDIGNRPTDQGFSNYFPGLIDELRVYNRSLCKSDIWPLYNNFTTPQPYHVTTTQATSPGIFPVECEETIVVNGITYMRWFHVKDVYRDTNDVIVPSGTSGAVEDPSTQYVVVRVTWTGNNTGLYFSQYLTRSRNEVFRQTDWSGGPGQDNFPGDDANHKFSTSTANIDYATSSGSLYITDPGNFATDVFGSTTASIFDTQSSSTLNSILWQGVLGSLSRVKIQIAVSNSSVGPWNYIGCTSQTDPLTCTGLNWFSLSDIGSGNSLKVPSSQFNNVRYFRYKIQLEVDAGGTSPVVKDVIINYSP